MNPTSDNNRLSRTRRSILLRLFGGEDKLLEFMRVFIGLVCVLGLVAFVVSAVVCLLRGQWGAAAMAVPIIIIHGLITPRVIRFYASRLREPEDTACDDEID